VRVRHIHYQAGEEGPASTKAGVTVAEDASASKRTSVATTSTVVDGAADDERAGVNIMVTVNEAAAPMRPCRSLVSRLAVDAYRAYFS